MMKYDDQLTRWLAIICISGKALNTEAKFLYKFFLIVSRMCMFIIEAWNIRCEALGKYKIHSRINIEYVAELSLRAIV